MAQPIYRQIAEDLRGQIESGGLQPGQQLQTEGQMREHYSASRNTIRDAIKWLTSLGLVETRPGRAPLSSRRSNRLSPRLQLIPRPAQAAARVPPTVPRCATTAGKPPRRRRKSRIRWRSAVSLPSCRFRREPM